MTTFSNAHESARHSRSEALGSVSRVEQIIADRDDIEDDTAQATVNALVNSLVYVGDAIRMLAIAVDDKL